MQPKKWIGLFISLMFIVGLSGCNKDDLKVTLMMGDEVYQEIEAKNDDMISLPILEKELSVFVGWSDGNNLYYDEYQASESITLIATFELISDVFEYQSFTEGDLSYIGITGYTGAATHLKVPTYINEKIVLTLESHSFKESNLVEIILPIEILLHDYVFEGSNSLESITFYGEYLIPYVKTLSQVEYNEVMNQYSDLCVITSGSIEEGEYTFADGCPIIEVTQIKSVNIAGTVYTNYTTLMDKNAYPNSTQMTFGPFSLQDIPNLTTLEIPKNTFIVSPQIFESVPSLSTFIISDDHPRYQLIDGVIYFLDGSTLIYYPAGLSAESFTIPSSVTDINQYAFYQNINIKTITLPSTFRGDFIIDGLLGLEEIIVEEGNTVYQTIDGVLYKGSELVKYPANKDLEQFSLPSGVISLGSYSFSSNQNLTMLDLGNELVRINAYAFVSTKSLKTLSIPISVDTLDNFIFSNSSVVTLLISRDFVIYGDMTHLNYSLGLIDEDQFAIYVPDASYSDYLSDDTWVHYESFFHPLSEYTNE
ncbi:MAG: leucine-rich repeat protein [Candidatus Izemoplasmatales bacterium]